MNLRQHQRFETALSIVLTVTALLVGGLFVRRELATGRSANAPTAGPPKLMAEWPELRAGSIAVGDSSAALVLVVFTDFECPACRQMHKTIKRLQSDVPGTIGLRLVHFPLRMHRFALPAARAASCASNAGQLVMMYDLLFEKQDSLGLKEWRSYAADAGIADSIGFADCVRSNDVPPEVDRGMALGRRLAILGTPTVVLEGWRFSTLPSESELRSAVHRLESGLKPQ